ncbi:MAG: hypothetical protein LBG75_02370 [Candidatus Nomurabacteria bacterium]|nr:hypothetical protein [Candidatus Nomurabacteria bacterium]
MSEQEITKRKEFKPAFVAPEHGAEEVEVEEQFEKQPLEDVFEALSDERYLVYGHGTLKQDSARSIMDNGLNSYHHELAGTAKTLDTGSFDELQDELSSWRHLNAKNIVLLRLPKQFMSRHMSGDAMPPKEPPINTLQATSQPIVDDSLGFFKDKAFVPKESGGGINRLSADGTRSMFLAHMMR